MNSEPLLSCEVDWTFMALVARGTGFGTWFRRPLGLVIRPWWWWLFGGGPEGLHRRVSCSFAEPPGWTLAA